jgi:hypothetical protein
MDPKGGSNRTWKKLRNKGLRDFQCCTNIFRVIKLKMLGWAWYIACMGKMGNPFNVLPGYPERTVLLRIRKWKDNIKMNLKKHNGKT